MSAEEVRAETVRMRAFVRAAETQATKILAIIDGLEDEPAPQPEPEPQPEPTPDPVPEPDPQPEPTPDPQPDPTPVDGFEATWPDSDTSSRGAFPHMLDIDNLLSVVDGRALGFPGNALKVMADDKGRGSVKAAQPQVRTHHGLIPVPSVGETLAYRYYLRIESPDDFAGDIQTHGTQDGDGFAQRNWMHQINVNSDGTFTLSLDVSNGPNSNPWPNNKWRVVLPKFETLRIEHLIEVVSPTQFKMHGRVSSQDGTLALDDGDFFNINRSRNLADGPLHNFGSGGIASLGAFRTGLNGISSGRGFPFVFGYIGNVAIRVGGWIGA